MYFGAAELMQRWQTLPSWQKNEPVICFTLGNHAQLSDLCSAIMLGMLPTYLTADLITLGMFADLITNRLANVR